MDVGKVGLIEERTVQIEDMSRNGLYADSPLSRFKQYVQYLLVVSHRLLRVEWY